MLPVISVQNLGKKYILTHQSQERYTALRDVMANGAKRLGSKLLSTITRHPSPITDPLHEEFWALKDVSFDIQQGDRVGIIGRNGAGKSTLLKILSRITEPTVGRVKIKGRVASLLEVGTGFHPELTGRENIYLNGAILGMGKAEIKKKFDEIVAFAEVEKFLDTPVKHYSSGMYVRLAFAVAAHLEPEILVVDEVLAVGDAQFQKKCMGKMSEVGKQGRTVLFVSHNMNAIEQLCTKIMYIRDRTTSGVNDNMRDAIKDYVYGSADLSKDSIWMNSGNEHENPWFQPLKFYIGDIVGVPVSAPIKNNERYWICIEGKVKTFDPAIQIGYALYNEEGALLYWSIHNDTEKTCWPQLHEGRVTVKSALPTQTLNEGSYRLEMIVALYFRQWLCEPQKGAPHISLNIQGGLSDSPYWLGKRPGILAPVIPWINGSN